jgi:hypothetical protein
MKRGVVLPLLFFYLWGGQESAGQKDLKITEARYNLGQNEIVLLQQKRIRVLTQKELDSKISPVWCSASLEIKRDGQLIDKVNFDDICPVGWHYGIHLPFKQESPRHFILMKYGDYNSRTLVVSDDGRLFNLPGDAYRIFLNRYLIAQGGMADDSHDFSFFDLNTNRLLFTVGWGNPIDVRQQPPSGGKAQIIKLYTSGPEIFASIDIVRDLTLETIGHTAYFYRIDLETGKIADATFDEKVHRELTIDISNIDMTNDCECIKLGVRTLIAETLLKALIIQHGF